MAISTKEKDICKEFVFSLNALEKLGQFHYEQLPIIWFHVRNEFIGASRPIYGASLKQQGVKAGVPDYVFMWKTGSAFLEFKSSKGILSPGQIRFKNQCLLANVAFEVVRSTDEALKCLTAWGLLQV